MKDKVDECFQQLLSSPPFLTSLQQLGTFEQDVLDYKGDVVSCQRKTYWTSTRWFVMVIKDVSLVISPAFYEDSQVEGRFGLTVNDGKFRLHVVAKKDDVLHLLDYIPCMKTLTEYDFTEKKTRVIKLSPIDEFFATISNLDAYFLERLPHFESFSSNIIYQALKMLVNSTFTSTNLITLWQERLMNDLISILDEDREDLREHFWQAYILVKSLLDYQDCADERLNQLELAPFILKIMQVEEIETKRKAIKFIKRMKDEDFMKKMQSWFDNQDEEIQKDLKPALNELLSEYERDIILFSMFKKMRTEKTLLPSVRMTDNDGT
ncbi:MAG: hypothetical protein ACTSSI_16200 [Candidatus Helarchaeota archaeon]